MLRFGIAAAAVCCLLDPAFAAAPAGLLNRTVRVSVTASTPLINSKGVRSIGGRTAERTLYISSAGRVFLRDVEATRAASKELERAPEKSICRFVGSQLICTEALGNSAVQMTVKFDSNFQSCTVEVIHAGRAGSAKVWRGLDGDTYTAEGPTTFSNQSCSIQSGNPFAQ